MYREILKMNSFVLDVPVSNIMALNLSHHNIMSHFFVFDDVIIPNYYIVNTDDDVIISR